MQQVDGFGHASEPSGVDVVTPERMVERDVHRCFVAQAERHGACELDALVFADKICPCDDVEVAQTMGKA